MNKDLSKEYKEAVMNDLPDLWGRIEAAIDEEESKKSNETPSSNVINFSKPEENKVNTANKYAVNAFDNEPVNKTQTNKKKFRIPAWVFVAVPSAAILLVVIIPVGLLMMMSGLGSKSATNMMEMTTTTTSYAPNSDADSASYDAAATMDEPAVAENEFDAYEDERTKNAEATYDYSAGAEKSDSVTEENADFTINPDTIEGKNGISFMTTPSTSSEELKIINDKVKVKFLSVYENDEGTLLTDVEIVEVLGDYDYIPDDFEGFEEGKSLTAYMLADFTDVVLNAQEFNCSIKYIPDDDIGYVIEPVIRD
jgi:hypothetical protein